MSSGSETAATCADTAPAAGTRAGTTEEGRSTRGWLRSSGALRSTEGQHVSCDWPGRPSLQQQVLAPACFAAGHSCAALGTTVTERVTARTAAKARLTDLPIIGTRRPGIVLSRAMRPARC